MPIRPMMRFLRSAQTHFPGIRAAKFGAYNFGTQHFGWRVPPEFALLKRFGPVRLALDIGGNWGQSIHALKQCAAPGRIVSFEPNQELATRLQTRFANDETVEVRAHALGDNCGEFALFVPRYRNYVYDGLASLKRQEALEWLNADRMMGFDESKLTVDRQDVPVRCLDEFDYAPCVVKIDVQGAEELVVRGGCEMFQTHRPFTIVEAPSESLVQLMQEFGLSPYGCENGELTPDYADKSDVVFATDAHCERIIAQ